MKSCTSSVSSSRPQPAAMRLHNGTADGQSHPAALRFGGEKRRKDLVNTPSRQSRPRVTDRELELTVLQLRFNRKFSARILHGLNPIDDEVHAHLLQLHTIC